MEFPSLMFLRRIPYQSVRRRRIRALGAAADAARRAGADRDWRSRVRSSAGRRSPPRRRTARASWSSWSIPRTAWGMAIAGRKRRRRRARRSTDWRPATADRSCSFSTGADLAVRSTADRGRLLAALSSAAVGPGATRFAPALKLGGSLLGESPLPRREVLLISDFQRRGWEDTPGSDDVRLPDRTVLTPVAVGDGDDHEPVGHAGLARAHAVRESGSRHRDGRRRQPWRRAASRVPVTLEVNGRVDSDAAGRRRGERDGERDVRAVHDRVAQHARDRPDPGRQPRARQRFQFRRCRRPSRSRSSSSDGRAPSARTCILRARSSIGDAPRVDADRADDRRRHPTPTPAPPSVVDRQRRAGAGRRRRSGWPGSSSAGGGLLVAAGPHASWPAQRGRRPARRCPAMSSIARPARRRDSARSSTAIRSSICSARRGAAISRRRVSTATAASTSRRRRCSRDSTTARRRLMERRVRRGTDLVVDVDARPGMERSAGQAGVPAVRLTRSCDIWRTTPRRPHH